MKPAIPVRDVQKEKIKDTERRIIRRPTVQAAVRKKNLVQTIASAFVGENGENSVMSYIMNEVLIPAAKLTLQEMITGALNMVLFNGEARIPSNRQSGFGHSNVSYNTVYSGKRDGQRREAHFSSMRDKFRLNDIYFASGEEAADVLEALGDQLEEFGAVTVADFYDLVGLDSESTWVHHKYGWTDLRESYCTNTRNGSRIVLPTPKALE